MAVLARKAATKKIVREALQLIYSARLNEYTQAIRILTEALGHARSRIAPTHAVLPQEYTICQGQKARKKPEYQMMEEI